MNILLVEDNEGDSFYINELLDNEPGFDITTVASLHDAIRAAYIKKFDIVLLDLFLPDSRGLETFYRFRIIHPPIPVIIITGLNDTEAALTTVTEGAQDYIVKSDLTAAVLIKAMFFSIERFKFMSDKLNATHIEHGALIEESDIMLKAMEVLKTSAANLKELYNERKGDAGIT